MTGNVPLDQSLRILADRLGLNKKALTKKPVQRYINWSVVGSLGRSKGINAFYYILFLAPIVINVATRLTDDIEFSASAALGTSSTLEIKGQLFWPIVVLGREAYWYASAYFAVCLVSLGHLLFKLFAPSIFRDHISYNEFNYHQSNVLEVDLKRLHPSTLQELWNHYSASRTVVCQVVGFCYGLGFLVLLAYAFHGIGVVFKFLIT